MFEFMEKEPVIEKIKQVASEVFRNNNGEVYLYGSKARQQKSHLSDWDLLILMDEEMGTLERYDKYGFPFSEISWQFEEDVIPVIYSKKEWKSQSDTLFYHNVMRDAIKLYS